jgi:hypothetical protein
MDGESVGSATPPTLGTISAYCGKLAVEYGEFQHSGNTTSFAGTDESKAFDALAIFKTLSDPTFIWHNAIFKDFNIAFL